MKHLTTIIAAVFLLTTISCTKEKRLENTLTKKDGVWNIDQIIWTTTDQNTSSGVQQNIQSGTATNAGTFTFDDNGTLTYNYILNDSNSTTRTGSFKWSVNDENFNVTAVSMSLIGTSISQDIVAYSGKKTSKNKIEMSGSEISQDASSTIDQHVLTASFYMTRK